jgi:threonyl-tRNA synthetase
LHILRCFGFSEFQLYLSTRPEKYVGSSEQWDLAEGILKDALVRSGVPFEIDQGGGVFYGPKIDLKIRDSLNRRWQLSTIQVDFQNPERFNMTYVGEDGSREHRPIMIHRALLGSLERFFGILIEHYGGAFPLWLAPIQALVLTVTDDQIPFARQVTERLQEAGFRAQADLRNEKLGAKIREAQVQKVPYMLVVGDKEVASGRVSPRQRQGKLMEPLKVEDFIAQLQEEAQVPKG